MAFRPLGHKTQVNMLLDHFRVTPTISALEAAALFRIRSLSRRVNDLEALGYTFHRDVRKDSTGQLYTRYRFIGRQEVAA